jgi:hypothetical protein
MGFPEIEYGPIEEGPRVTENASALELLQAVYRSPLMPLHTRMRAAALALPYESPKLAVVATVSDRDFASILDARIARWKAREKGVLALPAPGFRRRF